MRNPPPPPPENKPEESRRAAPDVIVMKREYRLLTPLYGGGVQAGVVDRKTPIHGTGVRGQLRFWWRATRGGRFNGDMAAMRLAEDQLWGSTQRGSLVTIAVTRCSSGQELRARDTHGQPVDVGAVGSPYSYVAFPLRESHGKVYEGITFDLELTLPAGDEAIAKDVQAALWAWDTFGGVGARTRRGFGALHCLGVTPGRGSATFDRDKWRWEYDAGRATTQLDQHVKYFVAQGYAPEGVSLLSLNPKRYGVVAAHDPMRAWRDLFTALSRFRQDRDLDSNDRPYGRSHWPEPDAVRAITDQKLNRHQNPRHGRYIRKFPRAAFGLPIIFEFKDGAEDAYTQGKDPRKTILTGMAHDRMASPLILRPLACRDGRAVGLALILNSPRFPDGGLVLKDRKSNAVLADRLNPILNEDDAADITDLHSSMTGIGRDVLQSFLESLD